MLQLITMPAQGHDAHPIVEHSIGTTKGHERGILRAAKKAVRVTSLSMLYDAVLAGADKFRADRVAKDIVRLRTCMLVVSAPVTDIVYCW